MIEQDVADIMYEEKTGKDVPLTKKGNTEDYEIQ